MIYRQMSTFQHAMMDAYSPEQSTSWPKKAILWIGNKEIEFTLCSIESITYDSLDDDLEIETPNSNGIQIFLNGKQLSEIKDIEYKFDKWHGVDLGAVKSKPVCECGGAKLGYGPGPLHSTWCPVYDKDTA